MRESERNAHLAEKRCHVEELPETKRVNARLPKGGAKWLHFKEQAHRHDHPCVVYADFETSQGKVQTCDKPNSMQHFVGMMTDVVSYSYYVEAP